MAKNGEGRDIVARNDIMELKELIEKFGKTFGFSWEKLEELFADLSSSKLHLMDVNVEASDLFSLALFWTAYQIASQPFSQANSANYLRSYPDFLNDLARNFLSELINSVKSSETRELKSPHLNMVSSWSALPSILSLTTESFAWYSLFLQTWLKNLQPVGKIGKKKKKSAVLVEESDGSANGVRSNVLDALNSCTHFFCTELEHFISWLTVLLEISEECETAVYLESITRGRLSENAGGADLVPVPGLVIDVLKSISNATDELGQRIGTIFQTWMPDPFLKKVVSGQRATLQGLKDVLVVRLKALQALKV